MAKVVIYTTIFCLYCRRAKRLLGGKGVRFQEIDVTLRPGKRRRMAQLAHGRTTVPQIFIAGRHIGGGAELDALEAAGKLDSVLRAA